MHTSSKGRWGNPLVVQWLGFCTLIAEGEGPIPLGSYRLQSMVKKKKISRGEKENGYWGWLTISARVYLDLPHFQNWNFFYIQLSSGKWEPVTKPLVLHFQIEISKFSLRCVICRAMIQLQGRLGIWVLISRLRGEICDRRISPDTETPFRIQTIPLIKDSYIH